MIWRAIVLLLALTVGATAQVGIGTQPNFTQLQPAPSGGVTVQWSNTVNTTPVGRTSGMTLSGSPLLTAKNTNGSGNDGVSDDTAMGSGKLYYVELVADAVPGAPNPGSGQIGLANASYAFSSSLLGSTNAVGWRDDGLLLINFASCGASAAGVWGSNGTVMGMAVDTVHSKLWTTLNGTTWNNDIIANQNPATNTGGCSISGITTPIYVVHISTSFNYQVTARYASGSWTLGAPSGFVAWGN